MRIHLTRSGTISPFSRFLEAGGASSSRYLTMAGIAPELLDSQEALIPLQQACDFIGQAANEEGIDNLGLEVGSRTAIRKLGLLGRGLEQALTLKDLIEKLIQWVPLVDSGARIWVDVLNPSNDLRLCVSHDVHQAKAQVDGFGMLIFIDAVRMVAGSQWRPAEIWLDSQGSRQVKSYEALAESSVKKSVNFAAFSIPRQYLHQPLGQVIESRKKESANEKELRDTAPPENLVDSIVYSIQLGLKHEAPTIEGIADLVGTSARSLQRNLAAQGTSYRELMDRARFQVASAQLKDSTVPLADIADHLGYSDLSNFSHAFSRWTGLSPSVYRMKNDRRDGAS